MELFRCILFLAVDVILSVQNLDTGGKLKHLFQLLSFLLCFSLFFIPFIISSVHIWRFHLRRLACMTGALWAKRGERDISHTSANRETRERENFFSSPRLALRARVALRAKYRVRPAWLIKRLSCRLEKTVKLIDFRVPFPHRRTKQRRACYH